MSKQQAVSPRRLSQTAVSAFAVLALAFSHQALGQAPAAAVPALSDSEIIRGIDAAVSNRENTLASYSVKDHYAIFRNGEAAPTAELTVQTAYKQGVGKTFTTLSQSGSSFFRNTVIAKVIASEKEMSTATVRDAVLLNSSNYEFTPEPGIVDLHGRACRIVDLKARRKDSHVFNGKAWFDAADFTVVHLEGAPSQSPSFFAGVTTVSRDYVKFDGIPMAIHAEGHSHNFLFGTTVLKIDSTEYQIQRNPVTASR